MTNEVYLQRCFRVVSRIRGVAVSEHFLTVRRPRSHVALLSLPVASAEAMDVLMLEADLPVLPLAEKSFLLTDEQLRTLGIDPDALE
jgi:hypothetical protein